MIWIYSLFQLIQNIHSKGWQNISSNISNDLTIHFIKYILVLIDLWHISYTRCNYMTQIRRHFSSRYHWLWYQQIINLWWMKISYIEDSSFFEKVSFNILTSTYSHFYRIAYSDEVEVIHRYFLYQIEYSRLTLKWLPF